MKRKSSPRRGIFLSVSILSAGALTLGIQAGVDHFLTHPAFLVQEVEVRWTHPQPGRPDRFHLHPATSIFRVDLEAFARAFQARYPSAEVIQVRRFLPNRLVAEAEPRRIVAQVQAGNLHYPISDDGTVVGDGIRSPRHNLPILQVERMRGPLRVGESLGSPDFWNAAVLLMTIHRDGGIAGSPVRTVKVRGQDLAVTLASDLQIRFHADRLAEGWRSLSEVVIQKPEVLATARYLDLRFDSPVIGGRRR